ncbi:Neuroendocrine convertase 2 [Melipona quadrifasciata]|uniref:Neuroendocrine convertase 2 n=1 Tax=Melipona quadrifasciata TaxID=166423 RepID=A0A0N0BE50_9HYME|nr:Neuroendocrine convertase 2 [Melipona quadrifasciata]
MMDLAKTKTIFQRFYVFEFSQFSRKDQTEYHFVHKALPHARSKRSVPHMRRLKVDPLVHTAVQQPGFKRVKRGYKPLSVDNLVPPYQIKNPANPGNRDPSDPYFQYQWYLKNTGQNGGKPKLDLNVKAAWAQGVTGKNVTTAIMDDGVDYMHPDLKYNYVSTAIVRANTSNKDSR